MHLSDIDTVPKLEEIPKFSEKISLDKTSKKEVYDSLRGLLITLNYRKLKRNDKKIVKIFLKKNFTNQAMQI